MKLKNQIKARESVIVTLLDAKVAKMKNKPFYLSKKEVKNLRKNKKQLSKYALKEISERLNNEK